MPVLGWGPVIRDIDFPAGASSGTFSGGMPTETAASIALAYAHQLTPEVLDRARFLVKGCTRTFKTEAGGTNYLNQRAYDEGLELVGKTAVNTFAFYCRLLWTEDLALESRWAVRTSNDAIDEAFHQLGSIGVVALQSVGGNTSMGWAEVNEAIAAQRKRVIGGVFYHEQDTARGVAGEGLWLTFGAVAHDAQGDCAVAAKVIDALRLEGVACEWDENPETRIRILPFVWQKRRCTTAPKRQAPCPWRSFRHPDGRRWEIAGLNNSLRVKTTFVDGDVAARTTSAKSLRSAIESLIAEQLAEGFVEMTASTA